MVESFGNYVTFYGASDDLVEVEGKIPGCDEFNTDGAELECGGLKIAVAYGTTGCWHIGVG